MSISRIIHERSCPTSAVICQEANNSFTNDDKTVNKSRLYLTSACHAESFLWVDEAYPGARPRPGPGSNHTKSGGGVEHGAAKSCVGVLELLTGIESSIPYLMWIYWQDRAGGLLLHRLHLCFHAACKTSNNDEYKK